MEDVRGTDPRSLDGRGDPASCRAAAGDLRALAEATDDVVAFLRRQIGLDLTGRWATAYGAQCRLAVDEAAGLGERSRALAEALDVVAELLDRAHALLARAASVAVEHGLVVAGRLVPPTGPESDRWAPWHEAADLVDRARDLERQATRTWALAWDGPRPRHPSPEGERCPGPVGGAAPGGRDRDAETLAPADHRRRRRPDHLTPEPCGLTPPRSLPPTQLPGLPTSEGTDRGRRG